MRDIETAGEKPQARAYLIDGLRDDYESWNGEELLETSDKDKSALYAPSLQDSIVG